jgi:hypothetical protein
MATPHIPDLDSIRALPNQEIKFYAIIGAVISLGAGLELAYFDVFEKATSLDRKMAASIFYEVRNTSTRRDIADKAMHCALDGRQELTEWAALFVRILTVTGNAGERNLAGHSVVTKKNDRNFKTDWARWQLWLVSDGYEEVYNPRRTLPGGLGRALLQEARYYISQDQIQIMAGKNQWTRILTLCLRLATPS